MAATGDTVETRQRLALGVEVVDLARDSQPLHPVRIDVEYAIPHANRGRNRPYCNYQREGLPPRALCRHDSGRLSVLYDGSIASEMDIRIYDHGRRYVPRRLRVPLVDAATADAQPLSHRVRRIGLFPGAAYDVSRRATALRGRVLRDGEPMRWTIVEASLVETDAFLTRTRGDDRGEFLLLLPPEAVTSTELIDPIPVRVAIFGPAAKPVPGTPDLPAQDDYWDLPLEVLAAPGVADSVSPGIAVPGGYVAALSAVQTVDFHIGRTLSGLDVPDFDFVFP